MEKLFGAFRLHRRCSHVIVGILIAPLTVQRTTGPGLLIEWSNMLAFLGLRLHLRSKSNIRLFFACFKARLACSPVWFSSAQHGCNGRCGRRYLCRVSYYCDSLWGEVFSSFLSYLFVSTPLGALSSTDESFCNYLACLLVLRLIRDLKLV